MPEDILVPAGGYRVRKRFRNEENVRKKKELPWSKTILDLEHNLFLARTPWAWFRIIAFYLVLYFLIALIVAFWILILIFVLLKPGRPLWLKGAPGLSVVPGGESTISFHPSIPTETNSIADIIDNFLDKLEPSGKTKEIFADCNLDRTWGYNIKVPCVFIKLNKVYGFEADTYDADSVLPDSSPSELKDLVKQHPGPGKIWLTCEAQGSSPLISYLPYPYFDTTTNMKGINRVIALQLNDMPQNEQISVTCKAWAKNIEIDMEYRGKGHAEFSMNMRVKTE